VSVRVWVALVALGTLGACFDGPEEIVGLKCNDDSHCGHGTRCVPLGIDVDFDGISDSECQEIDECAETGVDCSASATQTTTSPSTTEATVSTTDTTMSTTASSAESACVSEGGSCAGGEACCSGTCADSGAGYVCATACYTGVECAASCCCASGQTYDGYTTSVCASTAVCGQEASCLQPGTCSSPGSLCSYDQDCCGGRCVLNGTGTANQCFKGCTQPTDCVSGCCNYHSELATSLCEAC